jgi:hypothetical protein
VNSETDEMENAAKSVALYLECDYQAAATICQAAVLNDVAEDISRIADALETLSEIAKANFGKKEEA